MNERIRELADQARGWAEVSYKKQNDQFTSHWDNPIGYTPSQFFEQKFAELIVRECAKKGFDVFDEEPDAPASDLQFYVRDGIKKHFGVEE